MHYFVAIVFSYILLHYSVHNNPVKFTASQRITHVLQIISIIIMCTVRIKGKERDKLMHFEFL